ncbi:ferric-chelate reductase [Fusarium globosum]|uniref:ferric-chelate reductase (NADPH) n=1 Tax=Fusarium globosum TaxID=78864 RepID=A0A8H6D2J3_9HYPO|nr:ferric-chelate reductase [Fusarium globosum]
MEGVKPPSTKQDKNEEALTKYAAFLCVLMLLVIAIRWLRNIHITSPHLKTSASLPTYGREACFLVFQSLERRLPDSWFGRPSLGFILMISVYFIGNVAFCSNMLAMPHLLNHWASRFGWMCAGNMGLCVFFGLKNTPLGLFASVSHSQLNILHRVVGYTTVFLLALHALVYTIHFGRQGRLVQLLKKEDLEGMGAGIAMLVLLMGVFRHKHYELFYASHVIGFVAVVLLTALHRPNWAKKIPTVMLIIFSVWAVDRLIRLSKLFRNLVNNSATVYPLPYNGTRIVLKKHGMENSLPGSHCFLWIPGLRLIETHPFTIVSNDSSGLELVMKSHEGFTKAVDSFASRNPRTSLWASINGPYGSLPDVNNYDKLILIAGGSGAAFTFGVINRIMMQREKPAIQSIEFVWAVRRIEQLSWFRRHLGNLTESPYPINLKIYVTGERSTSGSLRDDIDTPESSWGTERETLLREDAFDYETISAMDDLCVSACGGVDNELKSSSFFEKLDVDGTIRKAAQASGSHDRVLVLSCGPKSLMEAVQDSLDLLCIFYQLKYVKHLPSSALGPIQPQPIVCLSSIEYSFFNLYTHGSTSDAGKLRKVPPHVYVKEDHVQSESQITQTENDGRQPVSLSWKLASVVLVTAIGFGSQWSSGVTSAMKSTIKKELYINNTQFSLLETSEDFMVTTLMLVSGIVTDRSGGAVPSLLVVVRSGNGFASTLGFKLGIGKIGAFAGKFSANIISKRLGFAWVF